MSSSDSNNNGDEIGDESGGEQTGGGETGTSNSYIGTCAQQTNYLHHNQ